MIFEIVDIFETPEEHRQGLQYQAIRKNDCAIFLYDVPVVPSFWNINVPHDLWVTSVIDGKVAECFAMDAGSKQPHKFTKPTQFVIESRVALPKGSVSVSESGALCISL